MPSQLIFFKELSGLTLLFIVCLCLLVLFPFLFVNDSCIPHHERNASFIDSFTCNILFYCLFDVPDTHFACCRSSLFKRLCMRLLSWKYTPENSLTNVITFGKFFNKVFVHLSYNNGATFHLINLTCVF